MGEFGVLKQDARLPSAPRPILVLGAGGIVRDAHLPTYRKLGFPVQGLYDIDPDAASRTAAQFDVTQVYDSLESALASQGVIFDLAVPASEVLGIVEQLPEQSAVLIQKPLGSNLNDARSIVAACRARRLTAAVNFQLRFSPNMLALKDAIGRGLLGTITDLEVRINVHTPWHMWPFLEGIERHELLYHSIHYLDLIRHLVGEPKAAVCRALEHPLLPGYADTRSSILLDYGHAVRASLMMNHSHEFGDRHAASILRVEGTLGAAVARMGVNLDYPRGKPDTLELGARGDANWQQVPLRGSWFIEAFEGPMSNLQRFVAGEDPALVSPATRRPEDDGAGRSVLSEQPDAPHGDSRCGRARLTKARRMRITDVKTQLLSVPLEQRAITDSQSHVERVEFVQVALETDVGITGFGMNWSYTPGMLAVKSCIDESYAPLLEGADPERRKQLVNDCYYVNHFIGRLGVSLVALAAVEFALWDIALKALNLPLWRYLGPCRDRVKAYSTDGGWLSWSKEDLIRDTTRLVERGFDAVKIKLGRDDPREDFERIGAVRRALGPGVRIMTDVNCKWDLGTAKYWGQKIAEHDIFWLEEPMHPFDTKAHAALARAIPVSIAVGETLYTKYQFRDFIEAQAVDIVQADATKLSGIDEWLEVAALAAANNIPIAPHTNVQQKLHVQLAAATRNAILVENCYESIADIWEDPIRVENGYYCLPEAPGVGLKIREAVASATRVA